MIFFATKAKVLNRGVPQDTFLAQLVNWGRSAPDEIFAPNPNPRDVYASVSPVLGPWTSLAYRRAAMLEVMRVLAGFESSWNWNEGVDKSAKDRSNSVTQEAGAWQVSMDALPYGKDLQDLTTHAIGSTDYKDAELFQAAMKSNHSFAMEFVARLLRHTTHHNGPVLRHEIDPWLSKDSAREFMDLLA